MANPLESIAKAVQEGLSVWKTYLATRQEAYERKMDRKLRKALDYGEQFILAYYDPSLTGESKDKELRKIKTQFFKNNN